MPDVFQIIVKEKGVFSNVTSPSTKAKLRILFEGAPLGLLVEKAGGYSSADGQQMSSLDVPITEYDQRTQARPRICSLRWVLISYQGSLSTAQHTQASVCSHVCERAQQQATLKPSACASSTRQGSSDHLPRNAVATSSQHHLRVNSALKICPPSRLRNCRFL